LGISFIHVTHSQDEAMALADLVIVMNNGLIEQTGTAEQVFNKPATEFVARFIGGHNVVADGDARFAIRADKITIANPKTAKRHGIEAVVSDIEFLGTIFSVVARNAQGAELNITVPDSRFAKEPVEIGQTVFLNWMPDDAHRLAN
jgi:putative spermidine/putrescine transport system ATP-binding protein